jgi:hypothetical protein
MVKKRSLGVRMVKKSALRTASLLSRACGQYWGAGVPGSHKQSLPDFAKRGLRLRNYAPLDPLKRSTLMDPQPGSKSLNGHFRKKQTARSVHPLLKDLTRLRKGEVFACVGRIHNLKDLKRT